MKPMCSVSESEDGVPLVKHARASISFPHFLPKIMTCRLQQAAAQSRTKCRQ